MVGKRIACLVMILSSALLLGEDVEREPIFIEPPPLQLKKPPGLSDPLPGKLELELPPAERYPSSLPGPIRLELELARPASLPMRGQREAEGISQRLASWLEDLSARRATRRDPLHPAWIALTNHIERNWEPSIDQIRDDRIAQPTFSWMSAETWQRMKDAPPSVGDTFKDPTEHPLWAPGGRWVEYMMSDRRDPRGDGPPLDPRLEEERFNHFTAIVEVRFGKAGEEPVARLVQSSEHPLWDQAALAAIEKALGEDWPGPESAEAVQGRRVVYTFSGQIGISSMLPVGGLGTDLVLPLLDPVIPAHRSLSARVELILVHKPEK